MLQRLDLADRVAIEPAPSSTVDGFAGDTLVRAALEALAAAAGVEPAGGRRIDEADPVAAGLGGGSSDAATALRARERDARRAAPAGRARAARRPLGADVPFFLDDGPQLGRGDGSELEPLDLPQDYWIVARAPERRREGVHRGRLRALRRPRRRDGWEERRAALVERSPAVRRPRDLAGAPAERPRLLAARRELRELGRLPRRRHGRRPRRLRPLPPPPRTPRRRRRALRGAGRTWLTVPAWYG